MVERSGRDDHNVIFHQTELPQLTHHYHRYKLPASNLNGSTPHGNGTARDGGIGQATGAIKWAVMGATQNWRWWAPHRMGGGGRHIELH